MTARSHLEEGFLVVWKCVFDAKYPLPAREVYFHADRKWRLDFAWPQYKLAVEIQGGQWRHSGRSAHVGGHALQRDCEKHNALIDAGWSVYTFTTDDLEARPVQCVEQVGRKLDERQRQIQRQLGQD